MGGEQPNFSEISKDVSTALADGLLSGEEETALFDEHEQEKCDVREVCQSNLSELKKYISHFLEAQTLTPEDIKELQKILSIPKSQRNGKLDDTLFAQFLSYSKETGFSGNISELIEKYASMREDFMKLSLKQRKEMQPEGGKDGEWGQNTFKYLLKHQGGIGIEGDKSVPDAHVGDQGASAKTEILEPLPAPESVSGDTTPQGIAGEHHPDAVEIFALGMTKEAYEAEKARLRQSPEYAEAREIARKLKKSEIKNIQEATGATIDGGFGVETYLYYLKSPLKDAGFSLEEVAKLEKIVETEDVSTVKTDITAAYGLPDGALDEIFTEITAGDAFSYDTKLGQLTLFDNETGKKAMIDVAKGLYDTIESAFTEENKEKSKAEILTTLGRISDGGPRGHYIDLIFQYIHENNAYPQARNIFCEQKGDMLYMTDFSNNHDLILKFKASHLFGDHELVVNEGKTYFRVGESYLDQTGKELKISQGTKIQLLDPSDTIKVLEAHKMRLRREELHEKMTDISKLQEVVNALDIQSILEYTSYASSEEKGALVDKMKTLAFEKRMFASIRLMFCDVQGDTFIFKSFKNKPGVGDIFEKGLTAFDLFGDYMSINVGGTEYTARASKKYGVSIVNGSRVSLVEGARRTEKDFEKLQDYPKLAEDFGKWVGKKSLGRPNGNCARGVADLLLGYKISVDRNHAREWDNLLDARVATGQFKKVKINHPSEAKAGGILCYNQGSSLGTNARAQFGHVEIRTNDGYAYDGFSSEPGGSANTVYRNREQYMKETKFTGYVYYPVRKAQFLF